MRPTLAGADDERVQARRTRIGDGERDAPGGEVDREEAPQADALRGGGRIGCESTRMATTTMAETEVAPTIRPSWSNGDTRRRKR